MDHTDPNIFFDSEGYCNHCTTALRKINQLSCKNEFERERNLLQLVRKIKESAKGKKYDCIIGLSGGVDSSYLAYIVVKKLGLRPLAVHLDNGWNSELAVQNIEKIVKKLNIDLYTYVIDWEEFRELQKAYLKASVIDLEVLSDNAIVIAIHKLLRKFRLKYFLIGFNYKAESIMPESWLYSPKYDSLNISSIYKEFGSGKKLKTYPMLSFLGYLHYRFFDKSRSINILDIVPYEKEKAIKVLQDELGWRDYGGKHYESKITHFYQAYILPVKFKVDKRKAHLSSLIVSGQISREMALKKLAETIITNEVLAEEKVYFLKKLGITDEEFDTILHLPIRSHFDFPSYNHYIDILISFKNRLFNAGKH
jgi:N-acetyl sugar amidotransferase